MRSLSLRPDDSLTIPKDGFVDRLHSFRLLRECDPSYRVLTLALVGLPPTEYASLKLDTHRKPDFAGTCPRPIYRTLRFAFFNWARAPLDQVVIDG
jgi:hypothetical protein